MRPLSMYGRHLLHSILSARGRPRALPHPGGDDMKRTGRANAKVVEVYCKGCPYGHRAYGQELGPVIYCPFPKCARERLSG